MAFGKSSPQPQPPQRSLPDEKKPVGQEVVKTGNAPLPAFLDKMLADAGKGVSTAAEDRIVPLVYVLQANSPQVKSRDPKYIDGAKDGDIWFRGAVEREVVPGDEGFFFQPCEFFKVWLEWLPNRGGFVSQHADSEKVDASTKRAVPPRHLNAEEKEITTDNGDRKKVWMTPAGSVLVHTRQHVGLAYVEGVEGGRPFIIPMSSTGHKISREWMHQVGQFMIPGTKTVAASFARRWKFTTVVMSNNKNQSWSVYKIVDNGWVTGEEYETGQALHEAFARGEKVAAAPEQEQSDGNNAADAGKEI
jgi:hypothetical protein